MKIRQQKQTVKHQKGFKMLRYVYVCHYLFMQAIQILTHQKISKIYVHKTTKNCNQNRNGKGKKSDDVEPIWIIIKNQNLSPETKSTRNHDQSVDLHQIYQSTNFGTSIEKKTKLICEINVMDTKEMQRLWKTST